MTSLQNMMNVQVKLEPLPPSVLQQPYGMVNVANGIPYTTIAPPSRVSEQKKRSKAKKPKLEETVSPSYQAPSTNATYQPPSTNATYQPPSTNATYQPPSTNATYQQHSSSATYQPPNPSPVYQPQNPNSAYQPQTTSSTYQPQTTSSAYQPQTTSTTYQPQTTNATYQQQSTSPAYQQQSTSPGYQPQTTSPAYQPHNPSPPDVVEPKIEPKMEPVTEPAPVRKKRDRFNGMSEEEVLKRTLPDHLTYGLDVAIIGINPGLTAAYVGHHYAGPGNHFWKCLYLSGLIPEPMNAYDDYKLKDYGIGFTNIVERTSRGSGDLTKKEIQEGGNILKDKIKKYKPKIAVFNGKGIYEVFCGHKNFCFGKQPTHFPDCKETTIFVMPSSSARCSQLPRAIDKVPFYAALKKLRDYMRGDFPTLDESEVTFPDVELKTAVKTDKEPKIEVGMEGPGYNDGASPEKMARLQGPPPMHPPQLPMGMPMGGDPSAMMQPMMPGKMENGVYMGAPAADGGGGGGGGRGGMGTGHMMPPYGQQQQQQHQQPHSTSGAPGNGVYGTSGLPGWSVAGGQMGPVKQERENEANQGQYYPQGTYNQPGPMVPGSSPSATHSSAGSLVSQMPPGMTPHVSWPRPADPHASAMAGAPWIPGHQQYMGPPAHSYPCRGPAQPNQQGPNPFHFPNQNYAHQNQQASNQQPHGQDFSINSFQSSPMQPQVQNRNSSMYDPNQFKVKDEPSW